MVVRVEAKQPKRTSSDVEWRLKMPHRQHPETRDCRFKYIIIARGQVLYSTCTQRRGPGLASPPLSGHKYASLYEVQMEH
jgi:hypothetical protein